MKPVVGNKPSTPEEIDKLLLQLKQEKEALDKLLHFLGQRNSSPDPVSSEFSPDDQEKASDQI
jgi:hypothetical protein